MKKVILVFLFLAITLTIFSCSGKDRKNAAPLKIAPFTFAVFGNSGMDTDNGESLAGLFSYAESLKVDFIVNLGNSLPYNAPSAGLSPLWDAAENVFGISSVPIYPLAGINDVFDSLSYTEYIKRHGPLFYSFERNGVLFAMVSGCDGAFSAGFGAGPRYGDVQLKWLEDTLALSRCKVKVVFMERPVWNGSPQVWSEKLLPVLKKGGVRLIVGCSSEGLRDYGETDGIRIVTTGCTGPSKATGPGIYPHLLVADVKAEGEIVFRVLSVDGKTSDNIAIDNKFTEAYEKIIKTLEIKPIRLNESANLSESPDIAIKNEFTEDISGQISFKIYKSSSWKINPEAVPFSLTPGSSSALKIRLNAVQSELAPLPVYNVELKLKGRTVLKTEKTVTVIPEKPRTGNVVPIGINIADVIPYSFDGNSVKIPVDVESPDTCGRLAVYREDENGERLCCYVSPLVDFRQGINNFSWNGRDLDGAVVPPGAVTFMVCAYNKKAPVTWVARGPWDNEGSFSVTRSVSGLIAETHGINSLVTYKIGSGTGAPSGDESKSLDSILGGLPITSYTRGAGKTFYLLTGFGVVSVTMDEKGAGINTGFGDRGFVRFTKFRGRKPGSIAFYNNLVYIGLGSGIGSAPGILVLDGSLGYEKTYIDLGDFISGFPEAPAVTANESGIFCAHPKSDLVMKFNHYGEIQWVKEPGDLIGDLDSDGVSFNYGITVDKFGLSYVSSPGTSSRCGVIGPDGKGLFRIILVQLPGLRVSSAFPVIEGKNTDGLYFVTRGGDVPYVFHIPYTVSMGKIGEK